MHDGLQATGWSLLCRDGPFAINCPRRLARGGPRRGAILHYAARSPSHHHDVWPQSGSPWPARRHRLGARLLWQPHSHWRPILDPVVTAPAWLAAKSVGVGPSRPARDNVTVHLSPEANENDAVTRGISFVPFQLVIGHRDFCPVRNYTLAVRNDGYVVVLVNLE
jgi:hypothetical protein